MRRWILWQLGRLRVALCRHDGRNVVADLNEGDGRPIAWCRDCGSVRRGKRDHWEWPLDPRRPGPVTSPEAPRG